MADEQDGKGDKPAPPGEVPATPPQATPSPEASTAPPTPKPPAAPRPAVPAAPAAPPAAPKANPLTSQVPSAALDRIREKFSNQVVDVSYYAGEVTVKLKQERAEEIWRFLRDDPALRFDYLSNLTAVHWPERPQPFEVVLHLFSVGTRERITLKLDVGEGEQPPTASRVWPTANWHEREVFDLFGISFHGHPDMTRILMTDDWVGHPLRKDYPLEGKPEDHMQLREVTTAEHVYTFDKSTIKGFGWKKEVEKTGEGRG
jgi:NADH-quinone oxidoreductase subunit C